MCIFLCFSLCGLCALRVKSFGLDSSKAQHRVHREKITEFTEKTFNLALTNGRGAWLTVRAFHSPPLFHQGGLHASLEALRLKGSG